MAKGKYEEWLTSDGLLRLKAWARDGLSDIQIAKNCGIAPSTLYEWKKKYSEFSEALSRGKEVVDIEVENALHKRALGYTVQLKKTFKLRSVEYDKDSGRKLREYEELVTAYDEMHVSADVQAQKFWLSNRKSEAWKERRREDEADKTINVVLDIDRDDE